MLNWYICFGLAVSQKYTETEYLYIPSMAYGLAPIASIYYILSEHFHTLDKILIR